MPPQYSFPIPSVYCLEILDCFPQMWLIRLFLYSIIHSKHSTKFQMLAFPVCFHVCSQCDFTSHSGGMGPFHDCRASRGRSCTGEANSNHCIVSSLTFSYTWLTDFTLHFIAGPLDTTHCEKSPPVITVLCSTLFCTSIYTDQFAIHAVLCLNVNTHLTCWHSVFLCLTAVVLL